MVVAVAVSVVAVPALVLLVLLLLLLFLWLLLFLLFLALVLAFVVVVVNRRLREDDLRGLGRGRRRGRRGRRRGRSSRRGIRLGLGERARRRGFGCRGLRLPHWNAHVDGLLDDNGHRAGLRGWRLLQHERALDARREPDHTLFLRLCNVRRANRRNRLLMRNHAPRHVQKPSEGCPEQ